MLADLERQGLRGTLHAAQTSRHKSGGLHKIRGSGPPPVEICCDLATFGFPRENISFFFPSTYDRYKCQGATQSEVTMFWYIIGSFVEGGAAFVSKNKNMGAELVVDGGIRRR